MVRGKVVSLHVLKTVEGSWCLLQEAFLVLTEMQEGVIRAGERAYTMVGHKVPPGVS